MRRSNERNGCARDDCYKDVHSRRSSEDAMLHSRFEAAVILESLMGESGEEVAFWVVAKIIVFDPFMATVLTFSQF